MQESIRNINVLLRHIFLLRDRVRNEDIYRQLDSLRREIRSLDRSIGFLKQEELREVYGDQVRTVLEDRIERHFSGREGQGKDRCSALVSETVDAFQKEGKDRALEVLGRFEPECGGHASAEGPEEDDGFAIDLIARLKGYLDTSDRVFRADDAEAEGERARHAEAARVRLSPAAAERFLAPLSNARRIELLKKLMAEDLSLAELSRSTGLQKGHLQFHLRALLDSRYIIHDRKSRLYSITAQGRTALEAVARLVAELTAA